MGIRFSENKLNMDAIYLQSKRVNDQDVYYFTEDAKGEKIVTSEKYRSLEDLASIIVVMSDVPDVEVCVASPYHAAIIEDIGEPGEFHDPERVVYLSFMWATGMIMRPSDLYIYSKDHVYPWEV